MAPGNACLINAPVAAGFQWVRASANFGQFKDTQRAYGLNFTDAQSAEAFAR
jgi:WH1 domain